LATEGVERADISSIPTRAIEAAISDHEWAGVRRTDPNSLIDKFHLIPALQYCGRDRFRRQVLSQTLPCGREDRIPSEQNSDALITAAISVTGRWPRALSEDLEQEQEKPRRPKHRLRALSQQSELRAIVEAVEADFYRSFEQQARQRLRGRDEADWPILATALGLGCGRWTEDQDFFGTGVALWTTNRIELLLEQESSASGSERSELS
jgi:hypothetical protein